MSSHNPALDVRVIAERLNVTPRELEQAMQQYVSEQKQELATNPLSAFVYPETLQAFMQAAGPVTVVRSEGRSIHVRRKSGRFPQFADLAQDLLGTGQPCDQFSVDGADLYARLKTIGQVCADNAAIGWDDNYLGIDHVIGGAPGTGELWTNCFGDMAMADHRRDMAEPSDSPVRGAAPRKGKKKVPGGAATFVMKAMKLAAPVGAIDTAKLIAESVKLMPTRKDARGQDRREDYAARAIQKLVGLELLYVHGDQQQQISLTALVTE